MVTNPMQIGIWRDFSKEERLLISKTLKGRKGKGMATPPELVAWTKKVIEEALQPPRKTTSGKPKGREAREIWPDTSREIRRPTEDVRLEWSHENRSWSVQFNDLYILLHAAGQLGLPVQEDKDRYASDPSLCRGSEG